MKTLYALFIYPALTFFLLVLSSFDLPPASGSFINFNNGATGSVVEVAVSPSGELFATGSFTSVNGGTTGASRIAKWNGMTWEPLGFGLSGTGRAMVFDSAGNLYVGGSFNTAGGVLVNDIAKWDGTSWSALGSGTDNQIFEIEIDGNDNLYVAGDFTSVGGVSANNIAKWDGSNWSALGSGTNGSVTGLDVDSGGSVYVCGNFTVAGSVSVNSAAKWDGSNWTDLGLAAFAGFTYELAVSPSGKIYVGGTFTTVGGVYVGGIIEWNGTSWGAMGTGLSDAVFSLNADEDGTVYVGGDFNSASGVNARKIAKWDGTSWSGLGNGLSDRVSSIDLDIVGDVYMGGTFTFAGSTLVNRVTKWESVFLSTELLVFEANQVDKTVQLSWQTETEENNKGFEVQRSPNGENWETLEFIRGAGHSSTSKSYLFRDENPIPKTSYYRLAIEDFSGQVEYSEIRSVEFEASTSLSVFPNPSSGVFQINGDFSEEAPYQVFDIYGRLVQDGYLNQNFLDLKSLSDGHYFLSVLNSNPVRSIRLVKKALE